MNIIIVVVATHEYDLFSMEVCSYMHARAIGYIHVRQKKQTVIIITYLPVLQHEYTFPDLG